MQDPVTHIVVRFFSSPGAALLLAGFILAFGLGLIAVSSFTDYRPLLRELNDRWNLLSANRGARLRQGFAENFADYDRRFASVSSGTSSSAALILGWANYRSLLVEVKEEGRGAELATSVRAAEAYDRLDEPARALEWWANILVAVGLVVTFLGIVAALTEATSAVNASGGANGAAVQSALMGLLAIAATKFWTSIAGVLASIILRIVARFRRKRIEQMEASFFESLDACVSFVPPEKVAIEQLKSLKRIEQALAASAPQS